MSSPEGKPKLSNITALTKPRERGWGVQKLEAPKQQPEVTAETPHEAEEQTTVKPGDYGSREWAEELAKHTGMYDADWWYNSAGARGARGEPFSQTVDKLPYGAQKEESTFPDVQPRRHSAHKWNQRELSKAEASFNKYIRKVKKRTPQVKVLEWYAQRWEAQATLYNDEGYINREAQSESAKQKQQELDEIEKGIGEKLRTNRAFERAYRDFDVIGYELWFNRLRVHPQNVGSSAYTQESEGQTYSSVATDLREAIENINNYTKPPLHTQLVDAARKIPQIIKRGN
jgi:hypothetical protein